MIENHNEPVCAGVGHGVACVTLVRCGHRESFTATMWVSRSDTDDSSETVLERSVQFGPFDDWHEIQTTLFAMMQHAADSVTQLTL